MRCFLIRVKVFATCGRMRKVVDTTGAGDTFTGYYLAGIEAGMSDEEAIYRATTASSICITRMGAAPSIPLKEEVDTKAGIH